MKTGNVRAAALYFLVVFTLLLGAEAATAGSVSYPTAPANPKTARECSMLRRAYYSVSQQLSAQHSALGMGRGRQVYAGPCCRAEAPGNGAWCTPSQPGYPRWVTNLMTSVGGFSIRINAIP